MEASFAEENVPEAELVATLERLDRDLAAGQTQLDERRARQRAAIGQLKGMRAALSDLSWELEELEQRLHDLEAQREGPSDPLAEREIASLLGKRASLEERALAQMLNVDELAAAVAAEEQLLPAAIGEWAAHAAALQAQRAQIADLLARSAGPHSE